MSTLDEGDILGAYRACAQDTPRTPVDTIILRAAQIESQHWQPKPHATAAIVALTSAISAALLVGDPRSVSDFDFVVTQPTQSFTNRKVSPTRASTQGAAAFTMLGPDMGTPNISTSGPTPPETSPSDRPASSTRLAASAPRNSLNAPGALDELARNNPKHYAIIQQILNKIDQLPELAVPRWIQAHYNTSGVSYSPLLLTSDPPRKRLIFTLDSTRYGAIVTLTHDGARIDSDGDR